MSSQINCYFYTGFIDETKQVIYATSRARVYGFDNDDSEWANMGQGAPEIGPIDGAPQRSFTLSIQDNQLE